LINGHIYAVKLYCINEKKNLCRVVGNSLAVRQDADGPCRNEVSSAEGHVHIPVIELVADEAN
jgi:hypothetical protein